jgi:hypothetical protein
MSTDVTPPQNELLALSEWFAALRRAGWFALVPAEEWHTLSALLSFPHRDGACSFTPEQVAYVLGTEETEATRRLDALSRLEWRGGPFLTFDRDVYGKVCGASLAPLGLFGSGPSLEYGGSSSWEDPAGEATSGAPSLRGSGLALRLQDAGLYPDQVDRLLSSYSEDRIIRQLDWLPARKARVPAAMLVRAVEGDWGPPKAEKATAKEEQPPKDNG